MIGLAHAHERLAHESAGLWSAWSFDPLVLVPLALAIVLYARGALRFGAREACFAGGMLALGFALVWPLDALGEKLFSMHMAQHMVMMNVAAPLLVLGAPLSPMLRALPLQARRALARLAAGKRWRAGWAALSGLVAGTLLQQIVLWSWHTPRAIAVALESEAMHIAMHASLLLAALLFWTAVLRPRARAYWGSLAALLVTLKITGVVCIMMLLQTAVMYPAYGEMAAAWGIAPADDEQLGWGLMMSVGTISYLGTAVALAALWLAALERAHPAIYDPANSPIGLQADHEGGDVRALATRNSIGRSATSVGASPK